MKKKELMSQSFSDTFILNVHTHSHLLNYDMHRCIYMYIFIDSALGISANCMCA
jgi:hypothetical protein